jgi:hypothetical protein
MKCDLPEPKKPDTQTPMRSVSTGRWAVHGGQVGVEEAAEVFGELLGDDVLVQLLPDAGGVHLVGLDHAVDRAVDGLEEKLADFHFLLASVWINREMRRRSARRRISWFRARGGRRGSSGLPRAC